MPEKEDTKPIKTDVLLGGWMPKQWCESEPPKHRTNWKKLAQESLAREAKLREESDLDLCVLHHFLVFASSRLEKLQPKLRSDRQRMLKNMETNNDDEVKGDE